MMLKLELIEMLKQMFALGGNHETFKSSEVRKKLLGFLKAEKEEFLLSYQNNENIIVAIDAIRFIDANNIFAKTSNRIEAGIPVKPFFERLMQLDNWNFYELKFLISLLAFTKNTEQLVELAIKAEQTIRNFRVIDNTDISEGYLACNVCSRLLYAKYFDDDVQTDLAGEFSKWFSNLERLTESNSELELLFLATKIRQSIFNKNFQKIDDLFKIAETNYDERLVKVVKSEICFYTASIEI